MKRVQQTAAWEEVSEDTAREKASQVLRDAVGGLLEGKEEDDEQEESTSAQPLRTVSAPVSLDEHEQTSRVRAVRPRPPDFQPPLPRHLESSEAKRRRYSSEGSTFHSFDERYSSRQQVVGYSPIRRHSENSYAAGVRSDPTSRRASSQGAVPYYSAPRDRSQQQQQQHNLGNLDEFDLFNGELLESDAEEEGPLPPDTHSSTF